MTLHFPDNFIWGAATSAYQIEGAAATDGRGPSVWDRFCKTPGKVIDGTSGDVACDHYHRFAEDVGLMREIGLAAYRFSIAWPRVLPEGAGRVNTAGLDFYDRLVDALLEAQITPYPTLFHWDLPQALHERGGWALRSTAQRFADYADVISRRLGDRVTHWITHNEPWCVSMLGHQRGIHAPGVQDWPTALAVSHHLLLSHGLAVPVLRRNSAFGAEVGISLNLTPAEPASSSEADRDACRHFDGFFNRWFLDPVYGRGYPRDMVADYERLGYFGPDGFSAPQSGDDKIIATPIDFLGINYYNRAVLRSEVIAEEKNAPREVHLAPESEWTEMGWEVFPDGLRRILERVASDYGPRKIFVTENGASYSDGPGPGGRIADQRRIDFLAGHFASAHAAIGAGVPLAGYFVWSLLDNFEWERGYGQRFGIVWVDYETLERRLKDSALFYRGVIQQNGV